MVIAIREFGSVWKDWRKSSVEKQTGCQWELEGENWEVSTPLYFTRYWVSNREEYRGKSQKIAF